MAKRKLKFGSPAWRKKYAAKAKRNRAAAAKRNRPKKKRSGNTYTRAGAAAKRKRLKQMIKEVKNPPRKWTSLARYSKFRVIKGRGGKDRLEFAK